MKILIVGGGGREHALAWKIAQSPNVTKIYCAPGNAGIAEHAECVGIDAADIKALAAFAAEKEIDLTVVGPEGPLADGIVDHFEVAGLKVFGPRKSAATLEGSKAFAKKIMEKYNIPTAKARTFSQYGRAKQYIRKVELPVVIKADGLAAGKGVVVCTTRNHAEDTLASMMKEGAFGRAGATVIIEEYLQGEEASFIAFTDGEHVLPLPASQDHKTIEDGDKGPNTGGMGAYSPAPVVDVVMRQKILDTIMVPVVRAMAAEGRPYKGVLYAGLMIKGGQVKVIEFNCRFGDPETQPLMMRTRMDIIPLMMACIEGGLKNYGMEVDPRPAVCVVMAAKGYPGDYFKGMVVNGLNKARRMKDVMVFHAGTTAEDDQVVTSGGRVLGVTAMGDTIEKAISRCYEAVSKISWKDEYHRKDIGGRAIEHKKKVPVVGIVMGSDSDMPVMMAAAEILRQFDIPYEITVASAHRTPARAGKWAETARSRGIKVIIAGAGHAAHLAGAMAAHSSLPVLGVPIDSSALNGFDALLSTAQMPPGVPVATMAIGKPGAKNAAVFAVQILSVADPEMQKKLDDYRAKMAADVEKKAASLEG